MHLIPPGESPAVFEVGLAFGNDIIAGDRDFIGDFSFRKFGISFAVTKELFSKNAEIIGILLNYDFNPYASLGFGGNFAHGKIRKYASFGINKRAFEEVVKGLIALFQ